MSSVRLKVDTNKDRLVSLEEFLKSTEKKEFSNPREWEVKTQLNVWGRGRLAGGFLVQERFGKT